VKERAGLDVELEEKESNKWGRPGEEKQVRRKSEEKDITRTMTVGTY
jgi:hypothetical protein